MKTVDVEELDYERTPIPDLAVTDLAGSSRRLGGLAATGAALLLLASPDESGGRAALHSVPALLAGLPHLSVHCVLGSRNELPALPPEARRLALLDSTHRLHTLWSDESGPIAVLLGVDGLLAGGPVHGLDEVEAFAAGIRQALSGFVHLEHGPSTSSTVSLSIDVLIPFRYRAPARLRNLIFTIGYYRRHLPSAHILLIEEGGPTKLPSDARVDQHLVVEGDPDLFNRSLLLNVGAAASTASHLLLADADCVPEVAVLASLESLALLLPDKYVVPHSRVHYLTAESSAEFIASKREHHGSLDGLESHVSAVTVGGVTFSSADHFHQLGGYDQQRFLGWGGEDDDLYNRSFVFGRSTWRVESELLHLDHPSSVWHSVTPELMAEKRAMIPPRHLPAPAEKIAQRRDFFRDHRVGLATNTLDRELQGLSRQFWQPMFPTAQVINGAAGMYGLSAFRELFHRPLPEDWDYLIYTDEDNFIVDWDEVQRTFEAFVEGGYGFAGMPDGGVISHRFHNPVAINPFMAFFDVRRVREAIERTADTSDRFAPDLIGHLPSQLVRVWDGKVAYPRIQVVLDEGYVPYGTALDNFEPYYSLGFRLLRAGIKPMYLSARDAPEMDDDGCCTALQGSTGRVMAYHSWFARSYGRDREQTVRINKVMERARSHVRW